MSKTVVAIVACSLLALLLYGGGYGTAYLIAKARSTQLIGEYEARLAEAGRINQELQDINSGLVESNTNLTGTNSRLNLRLRDSEDRVRKAKGIALSISESLDGDAEVIQRLISTLSKVADLVSTLTE